MTSSQWLAVAYGPCLLVALGLLAFIGIRYSQGKALPRKRRLRLLGVAALFLAAGAVLLILSRLA
jgi:hypothetical protein